MITTTEVGKSSRTRTKSAVPKDKTKLSKRVSWTISSASVVAGLLGWWLVAAAGVQGLPGPQDVAAQGGEMIGNGLLVSDAYASLSRVLAGFLLGSALAIPAGFIMGWYPIGRAIMEPWVQFFRTIPPLAIIPLAIVLLGIGEVPKVFVIFLAAFLSCIISTFQGVVGVEKTLINAARVLGAGNTVVFTRVVIPASTPFILVGMRVGLGAAWATVVAAELIAAPNGLGYRMQQAQLFYDLPTIFVDLVAIGVLGLIMDRILLYVESRLTRWQERR